MAKKVERTTHRCRDCKYATDFHELNAKGEPFLCKCRFQKRSMFLNLDYCVNFRNKRELW